MIKCLCNIILLILFLLQTGCKEKPIENHSIEYVHQKGENVIRYKSFYSNGVINTMGTIEDSIKINEELEFYPTGTLKRYRFFNIIGTSTYMRIYDEKGNVVDEKGCFYSHSVIEKLKFSVSDSSYVDFFVASPPNTSYKISGIGKEGGYYELPLKETKEPYRQRMIIYGEILGKGNYIILLEVAFTDSIKGTNNKEKGEISFEITDY